jgi:hypothetical protein
MNPFLFSTPRAGSGEPYYYGHCEYVSAGLYEKVLALFPRMYQKAFERGHTIGRKLHDEHGAAPLKSVLLKTMPARWLEQCPLRIATTGPCRAFREKGANEYYVYRQSGAAEVSGMSRAVNILSLGIFECARA